VSFVICSSLYSEKQAQTPKIVSIPNFCSEA
jgi:hypothetical protein